ncbi:MAG: hypothetical protein IJH65_03415 [Methanobrevibacter sp.]|nr:hypothetical protein [Methanobrevibacter sp.]
MDTTITSITLPSGETLSSGTTTSSTYTVGYTPTTSTNFTFKISGINPLKPDYYVVDCDGELQPRYKSYDVDSLSIPYDSPWVTLGQPVVTTTTPVVTTTTAYGTGGTWSPANIYVRNDSTGNWDNIGQNGDIMVRVGS